MGRGDLIGNGERHLVPRHNPTAGLNAVMRRKETPSPEKLAKKFGQNKPRAGAAIVRTPVQKAHNGKAATTSRSRKA